MTAPDDASPADRPRGCSSTRSSVNNGWWAFPLLPLALVGLVMGFLKQGPYWLFGWVLCALFGTLVTWIAISIFWPARAERTCPSCGEKRVERADVHSTHGLACRACGWRDETLSGWLLAEEEGTLEPLVLAQRRRQRRRPLVEVPRVDDPSA